MITAKNNATVVVLKLASSRMVLSFIQHANGGLSQGDDSSATQLLVDIKATVLNEMKRIHAVSAPMSHVDALLTKFPDLVKYMPADLKAKLDTAKVKTGELDSLRKTMDQDLAAIDKLLQFARLYDAGDAAKAPEGVDAQTESMIEELLNQIFPQSDNAGSGDYTPASGDMIVGCGTPGCEGCGGRKVFQFDENEPFAGLLSLGTVKVPAQTNPARGNLPEELKAIFGDDVHVIKLGGKRDSDPLKGLGELLQQALAGRK